MLERGVYWLSDSVEILYGRDVYMLGEFEIVHIFNFNHLVHLLGLIADTYKGAGGDYNQRH